VATCDYYADFMADYLEVPRDRIHVVRLGIRLEGHGMQERNLEEIPFTVGYLARICPEKGLHILADAFHQLAEQAGQEKLRLKVAGYLGKRDEAYFQQVCEQMEAWGLSEVFDYQGEVDRDQKIGFLNSLHVLSVPTPYQDPKGLFLLEAVANGIPVVQPRHGAFPEMVAATGGGLLVEPDSPEALAAGLLRLMKDTEGRKAMGKKGKEAVHRNFSDHRMAEATRDVYRQYVRD
jgi:glycosyltransferase involved in cell wall biosynthesis